MLFCEEQEDANLAPLGSSGLGAFSTQFVHVEIWRCDTWTTGQLGTANLRAQ